MAARVAVLAVLILAVMGCGVVGPTQQTELACLEPPEGNWRVGSREIPDVAGSRPADAAESLARAGIAVSWRYQYGTEGTGRTGYSECWCEVPPNDGVVQDVTTGDEGWLIVMVERDDPMLGGRPQPRLGWGCEPEPSGESSPSAALALDRFM